jgi:hypothetical protein
MTKPNPESLDEMLLSLQVSFFEFVWDAFWWIESIWIREGNSQFELFVVTPEPQDEKEWDDFDFLVRERFETQERALDRLEPEAKHKISYTIRHGSAVPKHQGYRELMSSRVFRMIAKRYAPWRREIGR